MKILTSFALGIVATASLATAGAAQTYSPAGSTITLTNNGVVTVSKGITLRCSLQGTGTISANGQTGQVNGLALSGGVCGSVSFSGFPYAITASSTTSVTLNGVQVTGITGNCAGTLTGAFNQSTGQITFSNAQIPSSGAGGPCTVNGVVNTSPAVTYTIP